MKTLKHQTHTNTSKGGERERTSQNQILVCFIKRDRQIFFRIISGNLPTEFKDAIILFSFKSSDNVAVGGVDVPKPEDSDDVE